MVLNLILILLAMGVWGTLHSWLASLPVKAWAEGKFGETALRWYRLLFNVFAPISLLPVMVLSAILPDSPLYHVPSPWVFLTTGLQILAGLGMLYAVFGTGASSFLGLRQLFSRPKSVENPVLVTGGLYRYVRHPIYFCGLVFIWASPIMTFNLLAFFIGCTAYLLIGALFEERKLVKEFGDAYLQYRRVTPMIIPWVPHREK